VGDARLLEIVINKGAVGGNDGWVLDGEFLTTGLGYQWFYNSRPIPGAWRAPTPFPSRAMAIREAIPWW